MSISKKLILMITGTVLSLVIALCLAGYFIISSSSEETAQQQLKIFEASVEKTVQASLDAQQVISALASADDAIALAIAGGDMDVLRREAQRLADLPVIDLVTICDSNGKVLVRGHSNQAGDILDAKQLSLAIPLKEDRGVVGLEPGQKSLTL
ncbi:MAG: hypothetical protein LBN33_04515, partial [Desulfovibrio sp.]|nr:hypothetical protein [Desulfovibrio sp.]